MTSVTIEELANSEIIVGKEYIPPLSIYSTSYYHPKASGFAIVDGNKLVSAGNCSRCLRVGRLGWMCSDGHDPEDIYPVIITLRDEEYFLNPIFVVKLLTKHEKPATPT